MANQRETNDVVSRLASLSQEELERVRHEARALSALQTDLAELQEELAAMREKRPRRKKGEPVESLEARLEAWRDKAPDVEAMTVRDLILLCARGGAKLTIGPRHSSCDADED